MGCISVYSERRALNMHAHARHIHTPKAVYMFMRRKEEGSKQGQTNNKARQSNTAHPMYVYLVWLLPRAQLVGMLRDCETPFPSLCWRGPPSLTWYTATHKGKKKYMYIHLES